MTGSAYQLGKFLKHTLPPTAGGAISVFDEPSYEAYASYSIDAAVSGSLEIDDHGRRNITWVASKQVGTLFHGGVLQGGVDAVKIVLPHDALRVHTYPTSSAEIQTATCADCGAHLAF